jgi:type IV pilus assembly protein PilY1
MVSNWYLPFENGQRVTGPVALFDTVAYFSTFTPTVSADACVDGYGSIWGVDYIEHTSTASGPRPLARLAVDPNALPITYVSEKQQAAGVAVFGVTVAQQPSCYETASVSDTYSGSHTQITASSPPVYQLVYQTGSGGNSTEGAKTNTQTQVLPPLSEMTRIDSWASIVE